MSEQKYPKVTTGAVIINKDDKVFLMRSPNKFKNLFYIPGGHVEWGESIKDCLVREIKEETALTVFDPTFIRPVELIFSEDYQSDKHIIPLDFAVKTNDPEDAVQLDSREGTEFVWLTEEEVVKHKDVEETTRETVRLYFEEQKKDKQCEEYKQGWQRAVADYKNLQKEMAERRMELLSMSKQQIVEEFIPVYDNFKKAFAHHPELKSSDENNKQIQNWINGIGHIQRQFQEVMKAHGVEEIKTVGEKFDPRLHEAAGEEDLPAGGEQPHGTILKEIAGGYTMGGRVVKAARVIIAK